MFASLITIVAALLLACASPHAEASVCASERVSMSFADLAQAAEPETVGSGSPKALRGTGQSRSSGPHCSTGPDVSRRGCAARLRFDETRQVRMLVSGALD